MKHKSDNTKTSNHSDFKHHQNSSKHQFKKVEDQLCHLQKVITEQSQQIEQFINSHQQLHQNSDVFKNLKSLFFLFQSQVSMNSTLNKLLKTEKQNFNSLESFFKETKLEISNFLNLLSQYLDHPIPDLKSGAQYISQHYNKRQLEKIPNDNFPLNSISHSNHRTENNHTKKQQKINDHYDNFEASRLKNQSNPSEKYIKRISSEHQGDGIQIENNDFSNYEFVQLKKQYQSVLEDLSQSKQTILDLEAENAKNSAFSIQYQKLMKDYQDIQQKLIIAQTSTPTHSQYQELLSNYLKIYDELNLIKQDPLNHPSKTKSSQSNQLEKKVQDYEKMIKSSKKKIEKLREERDYYQKQCQSSNRYSLDDIHSPQIFSITQNSQNESKEICRLRAQISNQLDEIRHLEEENTILQSTIENLQRKRQCNNHIYSPSLNECDYESSDSISLVPFKKIQLKCEKILQKSKDSPISDSEIPTHEIKCCNSNARILLKQELDNLKAEIDSLNNNAIFPSSNYV